MMLNKAIIQERPLGITFILGILGNLAHVRHFLLAS